MSRVAAMALVLGLAGCNAGSGDDIDDCRTSVCTPGSLVWSTQAASFADSAVTAVAASPGEPPWFAGNYDESVDVGGRNLPFDSSGFGDGFAARVTPRELGAVWYRVAWAPYPLHVAGITPDGEEGAILTVVGQQEDGRWHVEALWVDRHNETFDPMRPSPSRRATIALMASATATPPLVTGIDHQGWPIVAISGTDIDLGRENDPVLGAWAMVFRIGPGLLRETLFEARGLEILDLAATTDGAIVLGGTYHGDVPGLPACPETSCGFFGSIEDAAGAATPLRWSRAYRASVSASVSAVAAGPGGSLAMMLRMAGTSIDPPLGEDAGLRLTLFDASGNGLDDIILAGQTTVIHGAEVTLSDAGTAVIALGVEGAATLGDQTFTSDATGSGDGVIAELTTEGTLLWQLPVRSDGAFAVEDLAIERRQVAVGGSYQGNLSVPATSILGTSPNRNGYVLELVR